MSSTGLVVAVRGVTIASTLTPTGPRKAVSWAADEVFALRAVSTAVLDAAEAVMMSTVMVTEPAVIVITTSAALTPAAAAKVAARPAFFASSKSATVPATTNELVTTDFVS